MQFLQENTAILINKFVLVTVLLNYTQKKNPLQFCKVTVILRENSQLK